MSLFYQDIVAKRRAEGVSDDASGENDMIAALMEQKYKNGRQLNPVEIAQYDDRPSHGCQHTSSATSSWAFLRLASRPEIIEELYAEQVKVYGEGKGMRELDYETQRRAYLSFDAVVKETLRLHPPLHSIMRYVKTDLAVPPTLCPPPTPATIPFTSFPRVTTSWQPPRIPSLSQLWSSPDTFNPHRWLDPPRPR